MSKFRNLRSKLMAYQCLDAGYRFYYDSKLKVRHPSPLKKNNFCQQIQREYFYGLSNGYLLSKRILPKPLVWYITSSGYQYTILEISKGDLRCAAQFLIWGIGTSFGYWAGIKKRQEINQAAKRS